MAVGRAAFLKTSKFSAALTPRAQVNPSPAREFRVTHAKQGDATSPDGGVTHRETSVSHAPAQTGPWEVARGGLRSKWPSFSAAAGVASPSGIPESAAQRRALDRLLNLGVLGAAGALGTAAILASHVDLWAFYTQSVATHPIEAKGCISGVVYSLGDLVAQIYEGRDVGEWDRMRLARSGICGLLAHGPLSHFYYVGLDHLLAEQAWVSAPPASVPAMHEVYVVPLIAMLPHPRCTQIPIDSWLMPVVKIGIDQTAWSMFWNSFYYVLLGILKFESPSIIGATVRNSWWDLLKAGWRLWPLVHIFTYGVIPVEHRLLFVDSVELAWVSILSVYAQQQRTNRMHGLAPAMVACALPGGDGEGGDPAEEILRGMQVEREIIFEDAFGRVVASPADVYSMAALEGRSMDG